VQSRLHLFVRVGAAIGAVAAGIPLPLASLGVLAGADVLRTGPLDAGGFLVNAWFLCAGVGGTLGFVGLILCAILPTHLVRSSRPARRMIAAGLCGGFVGATVFAVPAWGSGHGLLAATFAGIAVVGGALAWYVSNLPRLLGKT
jgi:hypothetical protein